MQVERGDNMQIEEMKKHLLEGNNGKYSHMIVWCDTWDYSYDIRYVEYGSDINAEINSIKSGGSIGMFQIKEIYNYNLDLESQLSEVRAYHIEPLEKKDINESTNNELLANFGKNSILKNAIDFATQMHSGVSRINGAPYINHPLSVAKRVYEFKSSKNLEALLSAACLHDVVEDTSISYSDIALIFGASVASLVLELTTDEDMKEELGKTKYLSIKMKNMSSWALVIKLCDVLDNISDLAGCPLEFKNKVIDEKTEILIFLLNNRRLSNTHLNIVEAITKKLLELTISDDERRKRVEKLLDLLDKQKSDNKAYNDALKRALLIKRQCSYIRNLAN